MTKVLLNLGCGQVPYARPKKIDGAGAGGTWVILNHDRTRHSEHINCVADLNKLPWPWGEGSIHILHAKAVLEHLKIGLDEAMDECWRILKPGGLFTAKLPLWNHPKAWGDPTHRHPVSEDTFKYFDPETELGRAAAMYGMKPWQLLRQAVVANRSSLYVEMRPRK